MFVKKICPKPLKNFTRGTKMLADEKDKKIALSMSYHCLVRPSMAFYGLFMVLFYYFIAFYGILRPFNGLWRQNYDFIGLVTSFLVVIDPNSFGLVYVKSATVLYCRFLHRSTSRKMRLRGIWKSLRISKMLKNGYIYSNKFSFSSVSFFSFQSI